MGGINLTSVFVISLISAFVGNPLRYIFGISLGSGLIQTIGATTMIYLLMYTSGVGLFRMHIFKKLGKYSFSFYLWHFPILWLLYWTIFSSHSLSFLRDFVLAYPFICSSVVCIISVVIAYVVAAISYRSIEHPLIIIGRKLISK